ncbi:MAG: arginine--tRNA ligase [Chlamydiales bacterium]|nr:arginine--tRNA ligase [Chlamydiales bacterium]NCF71378.1 arginine--tRNA ligase [Chlamydiales bacterium]
MYTINDILSTTFKNTLKKTFPDLDLSQPANAVITPATKEEYGHYQFNSALKLAKDLKLSPRVIAEKICEQLPNDFEGASLFDKVEIAGPGFINLTLSKGILNKQLDSMFQNTRLGVPELDNPQKVIVEFSSPNTAKEMHVGHLRSTIIGECLARTMEFLGHDVLRLNHIGDWGTAFGMLITYIKEHSPDVLTGKQTATLQDLCAWYKASKLCFDQDEDFKKRSQLCVVALQAKKSEELKAWKLISEISRKAYQEIYDLLDASLEERGESFYNPMLQNTIDLLEEKKLITVSNGAKCVFVDGFEGRDGTPFPLMVQKSDGGFNYDTTDLAAMKHRVEKEKAERIIVVVDSGQSLHFQLVEKVSEMAGFLDPTRTQFNHVGFGLVLGPDGKKFKTRSGETVKLIDLLTTSIQKAEETIRQRTPDIPDEELRQASKALGIGAVKYADLSCNRMSDYSFSYDRMLRFDGNTACYVMYAYVRIVSIQRKVAKKVQVSNSSNLSLSHNSEQTLAAHLIKFPDTIQSLSQELLPNKLTDFLFQLADKFNAFFRDCRVEGSEEEAERLYLCELTKRVLEKGFHILSIPIVQKM